MRHPSHRKRANPPASQPHLGKGTRLRVDRDAPEEYQKMFDGTFPNALQRLKAIAEA
jgi:hypothetical protein